MPGRLEDAAFEHGGRFRGVKCRRVALVPAIGGIATIVHSRFQIALPLAANGDCRHRQHRRRRTVGLLVLSAEVACIDAIGGQMP